MIRKLGRHARRPCRRPAYVAESTDGTLSVDPGSGHLVFVDKPDAVAQAVDAILAKVGGG